MLYLNCMTTNPNDLMTAEEVAAYGRTALSNVYYWSKDGRLPRARGPKRPLRFRRVDVEAFFSPEPKVVRAA